MTRGRFITLEGGEGAGKSTQIANLALSLEAAGVDVLLTREPGGCDGAEAIRDLLVNGATDKWEPLTEALLNYAARFEHLQKTILPALDNGQWVISDRFADSTMAYQGYAHGVDRELIRRIHRLVVGNLEPDLTIILDLPVDVGLARAGARGTGEDRYERMGTAFHEKLRRGFLEIAKRNPKRCHVVDASMELDAVTDYIKRLVEKRLEVEL